MTGLRRSGPESSSDVCSVEASYQEMREAMLTVELNRLLDQLKGSIKVGETFPQFEARWASIQHQSLNWRYSHIWHAKIPVRRAIQTPIGTLGFLSMRRKFRKLDFPDARTMEELDAALGRVEFGARLSPAFRAYFRYAIDNNEVTQAAVFSLIRSLGSRVSREGIVYPNPSSPLDMVIGTIVLITSTIVVAMFAQTLVDALDSQCVRDCVVTGSFYLIASGWFAGRLGYMLSWGRRKNAQLLQVLVRRTL